MRSQLNWFVVVAVSMWTSFAAAAEVIDIGLRRELFIDQTLIERLDGKAELRLHHPTPREIAITFEQLWEGNASGYPTVFQDGDVYRM